MYDRLSSHAGKTMVWVGNYLRGIISLVLKIKSNTEAQQMNQCTNKFH